MAEMRCLQLATTETGLRIGVPAAGANLSRQYYLYAKLLAARADGLRDSCSQGALQLLAEATLSRMIAVV